MLKKNIIITIVALALIATATLSILLLVRPHISPPVAKTDSRIVQTDQSIITQLQKEVAANTILKENTVSLVNNKQAQTIYVLDKGLDKYLQVAAASGALVAKTGDYNEQQLKVVTNDLSGFLTKQGLTTTLGTNDKTVLSTVSNQDLICQLKTISAPSGPVMQIQLLCINKTSYDSQVSTISQLTGLWKEAPSTAYDQLSLETVKKDAYTVALLYAMPKIPTTAHVLVFVKDNDTWTYIGDAESGTSVVANEKYVINQSIKDGLDNPKYGSFLHDVLFGAVENAHK
jgi:hypothetical protein